eukprot:3443458-Amphidinium_carterae.1
MSAAQSRSEFFARHWECTGAAIHGTRNRHFVRKAMLRENIGIQPSPEEVLDVTWYQAHGALPRNVAQPISGGLIHCTVCSVKDRQCNRKKFMTTHMECLKDALLWSADGNFTFIDNILHRGCKKRNCLSRLSRLSSELEDIGLMPGAQELCGAACTGRVCNHFL